VFGRVRYRAEGCGWCSLGAGSMWVRVLFAVGKWIELDICYCCENVGVGWVGYVVKVRKEWYRVVGVVVVLVFTCCSVPVSIWKCA